MDGMDINKIVGANLQRLLHKFHLSQNKLAEMLNVKPSYVNAIIRSKKGMGKDVQARLCTLLKVRPFEFYIEDDTPLIMDESERRVVTEMRRHPEITPHITVISEALSSQYNSVPDGKSVKNRAKISGRDT